MSSALQMKLLRALQEREFERIGDNTTIKVDVRVIAATNSDLARMVAEGTFREDLYYRLNVIPVQLAPLRDRRDDIPLLAKHFLEKFAAARQMQVTQAAMRAPHGVSLAGQRSPTGEHRRARRRSERRTQGSSTSPICRRKCRPRRSSWRRRWLIFPTTVSTCRHISSRSNAISSNAPCNAPAAIATRLPKLLRIQEDDTCGEVRMEGTGGGGESGEGGRAGSGKGNSFGDVRQGNELKPDDLTPAPFPPYTDYATCARLLGRILARRASPPLSVPPTRDELMPTVSADCARSIGCGDEVVRARETMGLSGAGAGRGRTAP
jgi:hypothetical protein